MHLPHAVQHGQHEVGTEEDAHNGEALPLRIERTLAVPHEGHASWRGLCQLCIAAHSHPHGHQLMGISSCAAHLCRGGHETASEHF